MSKKIPAIIEIQDGVQLRTFQGMFEPPNMERERHKHEIPYMSTSTWTAGRISWSNPKIEFLDYYSKDFEWINEWMRAHSDSMTGIIGCRVDCRKTVLIKTFNENSKCLDFWTLIGAQIVNWDTNVVYDFNDPTPLFPDILLNRLTRKVLIEKTNNPTMQIFTKIELVIDMCILN